MSLATNKRIWHAVTMFLCGQAAIGQESTAVDVPQNWECRSCSVPAGWELDIETGPAWVSNDAYRFGNATGLDQQGGYLFADFFARYRNENANFFEVEGYLRGLDASALFMRGGKQSKYELTATYQSIPQRLFDSTVTPYLGSSQLTLPAGWVPASTTQGMTALGTTAQPIRIGTDRDIYKLGLDYRLSTRWDVRVQFSRNERKGTSRTAGSFLFNAAELPGAVDRSTTDLRASVGYSGDSWQAAVAYVGSTFENRNESLEWQNAYSVPAGVNQGQLAEPPDNQFHQIAANGSALLPWSTTLSGSLSVGRMTQNANLLAYTLNSAIVTQPLPVTSVDAEVQTSNVYIRAVSSPWDRISLEADIRYNDFDNRTPLNNYNYVITDSTQAGVSVSNTAYDYRRRDLGLRAEYRAPNRLAFYLGFDSDRVERDFQERGHTTTNRAWFRIRKRFEQAAQLDFDAFTDTRSGSAYQVQPNPAAQQNPLMRKYNMSDRDRKGLRVRGSMIVGSNVDIGAEYQISDDDFPDSPIGLIGTSSDRIGFDISFAYTRYATAYANFSRERIQTQQRNSQGFALPDWAASTEDEFTTASIGIAHPQLIGPLSFVADLSWDNAVGQIDNNTSGLPGAFPDLQSDRRNYRIGLQYPYSERLTIGFDYVHESFDSDDWALDAVAPDTIPKLLSLGADAWNYSANVFYLNATYTMRP